MPSNWDKVYPVSPSSSDVESSASGSSSPPNKSPSKGSLQTQLTFQPEPGAHPIKKTRMRNSTENLDDPDAEGETDDGSEFEDFFPAPEVSGHPSVTRTSTDKSIFTAHPTQTRAPASLAEIHFKKLPINQQIANQERQPAQQKEKCCFHQNQAILPVHNESGCLMVKKGGKELYLEYSIHSFSSAWNGYRKEFNTQPAKGEHLNRCQIDCRKL
ncbi:hypothetical protein MJO29_000430 [Puccinia striiformis f. sp. tritici]|nr:hypothetical protein MJO29_000430 [Puccinia striiformis f. sp. tritici]